jgi:formylglycine-generating enzyme required for sulfatase activity
VNVLTPTLVQATTPAGAVGQASISVTTAAGTTLASTPFSYVQQQITSIVPNTGPYVGGTPITITGQYLAGTTAVTIGGVPCTNVVSVSATQVTAVTPAGSVGAVDVVVNGLKGSVTVGGGFTYLAVIVPGWATLIEAVPDPAVVTDSTLRAAITATGLAWRVRDTGTQMEMMLIPPGTFQMGCVMRSNAYACLLEDLPVHEVTLTSAFYMGRYEVTQSQWVAKMGSNSSYFQSPSVQVPAGQVSSRPVEQVSWNDVQGFLGPTGMRLPTNAEWEYACRAGTSTPFYNGSSDDTTIESLAWHIGNCESQPRPVGGKAANGFGLYDMLGNVWEWANDWYGAYSGESQVNPIGPASGPSRVLRGGSWDNTSEGVRSSVHTYYPGVSRYNIGFRVAKNP